MGYLKKPAISPTTFGSWKVSGGAETLISISLVTNHGSRPRHSMMQICHLTEAMNWHLKQGKLGDATYFQRKKKCWTGTKNIQKCSNSTSKKQHVGSMLTKKCQFFHTNQLPDFNCDLAAEPRCETQRRGKPPRESKLQCPRGTSAAPESGGHEDASDTYTASKTV